MGWIRDRMEACEPRLASFSELAKKVRKAHAWPRDEKLKATSLATYLGKLDEGAELERFEQSPGMLEALAEALGMTEEELDERLAPLRASQGEQIPRIKLHDMPVRTIELQRDPLPPGFPPEVVAPESWPLWWHAPSGSGRTWAGQWLAARRLAVFIKAPTWADAERQFPQQGAVFVELGSTEGVPLQDRWAPTLRICVATEAYPPKPPPPLNGPASEEQQPQHPAARTWPLVESPPVNTWLRPLLEWLKERATGEQFDPAACLKWLQKTGVLSRGDNLGTVLGLIGLFATYARKPGAAGPLARPQSLADLARLFVRMRSQQIEERSLPADVVWERLCTLGRSLLLEREGSWREARPMDDWLSLTRARPDGSDLEWLGALGAHGLKIDPAALDKARSRLPPEAFRTVRALRELGLLREREPNLYAFRPTWVLEGVIEQAVREILDHDAPRIWGTLLVREEWAALAMRHLLDRGRRKDFRFAEAVVAAPDTSSPTWVAALEASFRILGLAVLEGLQVPESLHLEVLRLQRRVLVPDFHGSPQPRLAYAYQLAQEHHLLGEEAWYTALLVLSEALPPEHELALESWCRRMSADNMRWMIGMVTMSSGLEERLAQPWRMPLLLLGGRLLDRLALPQQHLSLSPELFRPELLLRLLRQEQAVLADIEQLLPHSGLARDIPEYARLRGVEWKELARRFWTLWLGTDLKTLPNFLFHQEEAAALFWRELPPQAVGVFFQPHLVWVLDREELYTSFQSEHWDAFVQAWISIKEPRWGGRVPRATWRFIPPEHVRQALRAGLPDGWDHETRRTLWGRMPEEFCEEIDALFKQGRWDEALRQAWEVPPTLFLRVLSSAEVALKQTGVPPPVGLSLWLRAEIRRRVPGWERAWMLLEQVVPTLEQS